MLIIKFQMQQYQLLNNTHTELEVLCNKFRLFESKYNFHGSTVSPNTIITYIHPYELWKNRSC